ncbi:MAG: hypothetical protein KAT69_00090 [Candidatus Aminicenantes bacterium]|nr:hypothetical protein [Candidatus Aminicenantes bacterium]
MNILIGFEESGTIREAFRKRGHNAWSCDLQPARDGSKFHIQGDIYDAIDNPEKYCGAKKWDLIILHPECTAMTVAGNHVYAKGKPKHYKRLEAIEFTEKLWNHAVEKCEKVVLENPQGVLHTNTDLPKPQYIQPYEFGEDASKKTGLTLHNLPRLKSTQRIEGRIVEWPKGSGKMVERWSNQTDSGQNILGPSPTRARDRSKTYDGIGDAMADQWGEI